MKTLVIVLVFIAFTGSGVFAQTPAGRDSVTKIAQKDARVLKLSKADLKTFRKDLTNYNVDYFNPNQTTTADTALLRDPVYVTAFKEAAYARYRGNQYAARYALFNELFMATLVGVMLIVASNSHKN